MDACDDGIKHKTIMLCTAVCMHADSAQPRNQTSTSLRDEVTIMDQGEVPIPSFYFYSRLSINIYLQPLNGSICKCIRVNSRQPLIIVEIPGEKEKRTKSTDNSGGEGGAPERRVCVVTLPTDHSSYR